MYKATMSFVNLILLVICIASVQIYFKWQEINETKEYLKENTRPAVVSFTNEQSYSDSLRIMKSTVDDGKRHHVVANIDLPPGTLSGVTNVQYVRLTCSMGTNVGPSFVESKADNINSGNLYLSDAEKNKACHPFLSEMAMFE